MKTCQIAFLMLQEDGPLSLEKVYIKSCDKNAFFSPIKLHFIPLCLPEQFLSPLKLFSLHIVKGFVIF